MGVTIKMITDREKKILIDSAKKHGVQKLYIFGSSTKSGNYNDIDVAIKGVQPGMFFKMYGELIMNMPCSVDLINLDMPTAVTKIIEKESVKIYG